MVEAREIYIRLKKGKSVSGYYHEPSPNASGSRATLIIGHGAGNDCHNPLIVGIARRLAQAGYGALRFNFPYRQEGRGGPDTQPVLEETYLAAIEAAVARVPVREGTLILSGKSMGGRIASQIFSAAPRAGGLIFFGYPLHPPGKFDHLRDGHLYDIKAPMLFIEGTRDPFCRLDLLEPVLNKLHGAELVVIQGGDHSYNLPKADPRTPEQALDEISGAAVRWLAKQDFS